MNITKPKQFWRTIFKERIDEIAPDGRYKDDHKNVIVPLRGMAVADVELILAQAKKTEGQDLVRRLEAWLEFLSNPTGKPVTRLEQLETALSLFISDLPHHFLFTETKDGQLVPVFVTGVEYHPPRERNDEYYPPYTDIDLAWYKMGKKCTNTVTWHYSDLAGKKLVQVLLNDKGYFAETPAAYSRWEKELARYHDIYLKTGHQYRAEGEGEMNADRWSSKDIAMVRDGTPTRVVMDYYGDDPDTEKNDEKSSVIECAFWHRINARKKVKKAVVVLDDEEDEDQTGVASDEAVDYSFSLPIHTYVRVFDFEQHQHVVLHSSNLKEYEYDITLENKLVMAAEMKELVNILVDTAAETMQDIVSGKTGGVIVIATGVPGTGKTLTAEVYSERIKKPLYAVQCSQLGTNEEELEKCLMQVLKRATRWQAILLIDEADVYVRERGDDIQQNAIVGVFLRLLEYYRGVLFLTSNRAASIDDAVLSRAIAHLKYELPNAKDLAKIWKVLGDNYKAHLTTAQIDKLVERLPKVSGRNVKNLLKLATAVHRKSPDECITDIILRVSKFVDLPKPENK